MVVEPNGKEERDYDQTHRATRRNLTEKFGENRAILDDICNRGCSSAVVDWIGCTAPNVRSWSEILSEICAPL